MTGASIRVEPHQVVVVLGPSGSGKTTMLRCINFLERADSYPSQLSGGQQRVGIARAIALEPEIILFDEPTSALEPELIEETLEVMKNVAKQGITMLVVTHELSFAQDIADKVIFMDGGVVVEEDTPEEIFNNPKEERTKQFLSRIIVAKSFDAGKDKFAGESLCQEK